MISQRMGKRISQKGGIRQAYNEAQRQYEIYGKENVFDLSIGNPSVPAPDKVKETILKVLEDDFSHGYMSDAGYEDTRRKIAESLNRKYEETYTGDDIVMTNGAAGGINCTLCALLDPGDEVILFRPYYTAYEGFIENWGGKAVTVSPKGEEFLPDYEELEQRITQRTKVVIVNSPHNPSGTIYPKETAEKIARILEKKEQELGHEIYLLSDEPYRELVYDGTHLPWWPHEYRDTIVAYSFSKSLSLAGERIGYLLIPPHIGDAKNVMRAVRSSMGKIGYVNAPALFQKVAGDCVDETVDLKYYKKNRDLLYQTLKRFGFTAVYPRGAFYIFVKCPINEEEFLIRAQNRHFIFVGGSSFDYPGYVRLSFCCKQEVIERAVPAFELLARDCGLISG
ncbi:MAG: pyridoxal phosphate-dependent aminotransferase [Coprococcus sp.]|nr:pyridoxal phosphate-dependent aminotransferase [Coprococcus sp.]